MRKKYAEEFFLIASDMFCIADFNGYFVDLNPAWEKALGWSIDELRSRPYIEFVHPDDVERSINGFTTSAPDGNSTRFESRFLHKNGGYRLIHWTVAIRSEKELIFAAARDITDSVESERRLQRCLSSAGMGIWDWDLETGKMKWDESLYALHGLHPTDFSDASEAIAKVVHPEDRAMIESRLQLAIEEKVKFDTRFRAVMPSGEIKHIGTRASVEYSKDGKACRLLGLSWDIGQLVKTEIELNLKTSAVTLLNQITQIANESHTLETALKKAIEAICQQMSWSGGHVYRVTKTATDEIRLVSSRIWYVRDGVDFTQFKNVSEAISFAPGEGLPGMTYLLKQPQWREDASTDENFPRNKVYQGQMPVKAGFSIPVSIESEVVAVIEIFAEAPKKTDPFLLSISSIIGVQLGRVLERQRASMELRSTLDALDRVAIVGHTDTDGKITQANKTFSEISGYSNEELVGHKYRMLNSNFHETTFFKNMWETIQSGNVWQGEQRNRAKDGTHYWVYSVIAPKYDLHGKIAGYLTIQFDTTKKKNSEKKLMQAAKMSTLGEMASGIAHEINNPLAIINGNVSLLKGIIHKKPLDLESANETIESVQKTCKRISKIIQGLRSFARSSERDPFSEASLRTIIEDTLELCKSRFKTHNVELRLPDQIPDENLICRPGEISQILLNLLNNSFDAVCGRAGAWVRLEIGVISRAIRISVIDSGLGIAPEHVEHLMEPFFTTKEPEKGTGLGLSLSKRIATEHNGVLFYDRNSPNTCFTVVLPLLQKSGKTA
jgi:PAS domain S-box-containing protein